MNKVKYKYIGDGAFVVGLPARDISEDEAPEYEALVEENIKNCSSNPCYERVNAPKKPATKDGE